MVFNVHYLFYPLILLLHIDIIECQQPLLQTATTATTYHYHFRRHRHRHRQN